MTDSIPWDQLQHFDDYAHVLQQLLAQAHTATQAHDTPAIQAAHDDLCAFITRCPIDTAASLIQVAAQARRSLFNRVTQDVLASLEQRQGELSRMTCQVRLAAAHDPRDLLHEITTHVRELAHAATQAVQTAQQLHDHVRHSHDAHELAQSIDAARNALTQMRNAVSTIDLMSRDTPQGE